MKCEQFKARLDEDAGGCIETAVHPDAGNGAETNARPNAEMAEHMAACEPCRAYYAVLRALTPPPGPTAPEAIKAHVLREARRRESTKNSFKNFFSMKSRLSQVTATLAAAAMIVVVVALNLNPSQVLAAQTQIDKALAATSGVRSMTLKIDVRTTPTESFAYTNPNDPMVEHTLTVDMDEPTKWRLEKGGRGIVFDGTTKWMWIAGKIQTGYKGTADNCFEEWFGVLLSPEMILLQEKAALEEKWVKYTVTETDDQIVLTAKVKAQGDFTNDYALYSSISESDTRREIRFDKRTQLIQSLKIFATKGLSEKLIVDVKEIRYNVPVDLQKLTALPAGYEWHDVNAVVETSGRFRNISAGEAAQLIGEAMNNNNLVSVGEAFAGYNFTNIVKALKGVRFVKLGEPFRSGQYPGVFVPFTVKRPNGKTETWNLALRNDNAKGEWVVDGGF